MIAWILWWWRWLFPVKDKYPETPQEIFDFVVRKLREQGKCSARDGTCMYRGPNGLKCAVGHLIPDDKYDPRMDEAGECFNALHHIAGEIGLLKHVDLLRWLQRAHDQEWGFAVAPDHKRLCRALFRVAERRNLNPQVVQDWLESLPA